MLSAIFTNGCASPIDGGMAQKRRNIELQLAVGERLRLTRHALGLKQHEFASQIGMSANAYSMVEAGKRLISIEDALALSSTQGITLDWVYGGDPGNLPHRIAKAIEALQDVRSEPKLNAKS